MACNEIERDSNNSILYIHNIHRVHTYIGIYIRIRIIRMYILYSGTSLLWTLWDLDFSPHYRGFLIQRSRSTLQYYTGTQNGVLIMEVSAIQRFVIERSHCIMYERSSMHMLLSCVHVRTYIKHIHNFVILLYVHRQP